MLTVILCGILFLWLFISFFSYFFMLLNDPKFIGKIIALIFCIERIVFFVMLREFIQLNFGR